MQGPRRRCVDGGRRRASVSARSPTAWTSIHRRANPARPPPRTPSPGESRRQETLDASAGKKVDGPGGIGRLGGGEVIPQRFQLATCLGGAVQPGVKACEGEHEGTECERERRSNIYYGGYGVRRHTRPRLCVCGEGAGTLARRGDVQAGTLALRRCYPCNDRGGRVDCVSRGPQPGQRGR